MEYSNLVSIIIPVYNAELYLDNCIRSVLAQTYKNIEVILINDGSIDKSAEICDKYVNKYKNVKVIHQKNCGPSIARNMGISASKGQYIQFVDSDDSIEPNMTEKLINAMNKKNNLVICGIKVINSKLGNVIEEFSSPIDGIFTSKEFVENFGDFLKNGLINSPCNKLYDKKIIKNNSIQFNENLNMGEDLLFNIEYLNDCNNIAIIKDKLYNYIKFSNEKSLTVSYKPSFFETQQMLFQNIRNFLLSKENYSGNNKLFIEKNYSGNVVGCLVNLFHKDSGLTRINKKEQIKNIVFDDSVRRSIKYFKKNGFQQRIIGFLIKCKSINAIYIFLMIRTFIRDKIRPILSNTKYNNN
ncbi:glycosyltransferase family 2 protein [Ectobacillus polymachus]|uniref:glycosyltransferase family 2 protein n=1 Tax=Ectobacillus polymachus TaxID=1508806 RepID=UPI003A88E24E